MINSNVLALAVMSDQKVIAMVAVIALVTALTRFLPYLVLGGRKKTPKIIMKLSRSLPCAVMGMLVVYCLKDMSFSALGGFVPHIISVLVVVVLHVWRRNTLLSIVAGTLSYMLLLQLVF
jgi:branched-subunit amino acid transport protein AzlD